MAIQQQIQELARQIAELSAQIKQPIEKEQKTNKLQQLNYKQLTTLGKQVQFGKHIIGKEDDHTKDIYLKGICHLLNQAENFSEQQVTLVAAIFDSIGEVENIQKYLVKTLDWEDKDIQDFITEIKNQKLEEIFTVDALIIAYINKEEKLIKYLTELLCLLDIAEEDFIEICKFVNTLLLKDYKEIQQFLKTEKFSEISKHYLSPIFKEIVIHDQSKVFNLPEIIHPEITEKIYVKNSSISFNKNEKKLDKETLETEYFFYTDYVQVSNLKEIWIEDCDIVNEVLNVYFNNIDKIIFKNINFDKCKAIEDLTFHNVKYIKLEKMNIVNKYIRIGLTETPVELRDIGNIFLKDNTIVDNSFLYFTHKPDSPAFIDCKNVENIEEVNNLFDKNRIKSSGWGHHMDRGAISKLMRLSKY